MTEAKKADYEAHISKHKTKVVDELVKLIKEYPIVGAVDMENMPAPQLQNMRTQLRDSVVMLMSKRRLIKIALEQCAKDKKGLEKLIPYLKGMPSLLFTKENPFVLFKKIQKNKSNAPAKGGQIAPKDIVVPAGPTPFLPGPVISELGAIGLKTGVEDGKVAIKEDSVVVKEGEVIEANVAGILTRLGIEPMEIGLDLVAVYEDGVIYDRKVLDIDEEEFLQSINNAARWAFNLAVETGHFTSETIAALIPKAFLNAKAVALEGNIMASGIVEEILAKAERQMISLKDTANIEVGTAKVVEKKEDKPKEETPVEEKKEEPESPKEEPAPEEKKEEVAEEKPEEEPRAEESSAPKEEAAEEVPKEEVKEEKPAEPVEEKKEEPKEEEKPAEEVKEEPAPEEKKEEETPQPEKEEKSEEVKEETETTPEQVEKEIEEIEKDIKEEEKDPNPENIEKIEEKVEKVEEEIKELEEEKKEATENEEVAERVISPEQKKASDESEKLYAQLKKEGTLRNQEVKKDVPESLTPQEIIERGRQQMKDKQDAVPSAHDLAKGKR